MSREAMGRLLQFGSPFLATAITASIAIGFAVGPARNNPPPYFGLVWIVNCLLSAIGSATGAALRTEDLRRRGLSGTINFFAGAMVYVLLCAIALMARIWWWHKTQSV